MPETGTLENLQNTDIPQLQHLIKNMNSTKMMVIRNYIIICFNTENIYSYRMLLPQKLSLKRSVSVSDILIL